MMGRLAGSAVIAVLMTASTAAAAGYDIPILYSARHIGAGGTAVADVHDSSAIFHNPSGMGQIGKGNLLIDVSLLNGELRSTPYLFGPRSITSEPVIAPFFLVGGSGRVHDYVTLGMAVYPVAAASGEYKYQQDGQDVTDKTSLIFMEASPAIAVNIDKIGLRIGFGYRVTYASLARSRNSPPALGSIPTDVDIKMTGFSFAGFRAGFQWRFTDYFSIGMNYRSKTKTKIDQSGDADRSSGKPSGQGSYWTKAETEITLPARISGGFRFDWAQFAFMSDFEWGFNSQNDSLTIHTEPVDAAIANVFKWRDQWTWRAGAEYRVYEEKIPLRLGFIYDSRSTNFKYPSGFSTPPTDTYSVTAGIGYDHGPWEINVAYARRFGKVLIDDPVNPQTPSTEDDSLRQTELLAECPACGYAGDYKFGINGFYVDFSWDWY